MSEKHILFNTKPSEITLLVEDDKFVCNKFELSKHSDYFKAMFEGNFVERNKHDIRLEGVDSKSLKIILTLLWDSTYLINEEDILLVLEVACMLQFSKIRELCIERIKEILRPCNCIKVWFATEQLDIESLYLKAKYLALVEFEEIKDTYCLLELNLKQLCTYLADINLQCKSEMDVFQVCMKWWYENCFNPDSLLYKDDSEESKTRNLLHLLSCLNYNKLSENDLKEMLTFPDLSDNDDISRLFSYIINLRKGIQIYLSKEFLNIATKLLNGKARVQQSVPCFLVNNLLDELPSKRLKISVPERHLSVIYHDQFKRKRYYEVVDIQDTLKSVFYFDIKSNRFRKLLNIEDQKCDKLDGFRMLCYKEFIFFFGGEFMIGRGDWNKSFWVYDNIKERWGHKAVIPYVRRHFESCIVNEYLYIIGGAGNYRIIQDNMFWYNYKNDNWSKLIALPCPGRQMKCCSFNEKLFLMNVNNKCGYLFDHNNSSWIKLDIVDENDVIPNYPDKFTIFSYNGSFFVKGSQLIELKLEGLTLDVVKCTVITNESYDSMESVLCNGILYSLYKRKPDDSNGRITLEKFSMDSHRVEHIFSNLEDESIIETIDGKFKIKFSTFSFAFQHWKLVEGNNCINEFVSQFL